MFELVAGIAYELLEGGVTRFFYKQECASQEKYFLCERLKWENLRKNQEKKQQFYNLKTIVRKMLKILWKLRTRKLLKNS